MPSAAKSSVLPPARMIVRISCGLHFLLRLKNLKLMVIEMLQGGSGEDGTEDEWIVVGYNY